MTYIHTQHLLILFGKPYNDQLRRQLIVFFSSLFGNGSLVLLEIFDGIVVVTASVCHIQDQSLLEDVILLSVHRSRQKKI